MGHYLKLLRPVSSNSCNFASYSSLLTFLLSEKKIMEQRGILENFWWITLRDKVKAKKWRSQKWLVIIACAYDFPLSSLNIYRECNSFEGKFSSHSFYPVLHNLVLAKYFTRSSSSRIERSSLETDLWWEHISPLDLCSIVLHGIRYRSWNER